MISIGDRGRFAPMRYPRILARFSISRRLLLIVWPFLAIVVLLVLLGVGSVDILSSVRAYVSGESLWSKAQKDAAYYLSNYARNRSPDDYRRFVDAIAIPLGDRVAREELEKPAPDLEEARRFADAIHARFLGKLLAYNCSPSFNWRKKLDDATIASFQKELGKMGYKFQFVKIGRAHV